ncbi:MAG: hypothetical protein H7293_07145 [Candidatus Saccharibacteria bacterium]|nr:hypothetical protein [Rhodoferax sp.]
MLAVQLALQSGCIHAVGQAGIDGNDGGARKRPGREQAHGLGCLDRWRGVAVQVNRAIRENSLRASLWVVRQARRCGWILRIAWNYRCCAWHWSGCWICTTFDIGCCTHDSTSQCALYALAHHAFH